MPFHPDHYIHELSVETISRILASGAWRVDNQVITSAETNDNDLKIPNMQWVAMGENTEGPNAFSDIKFDGNVKRMLDVGGGKYDCNRDYLKHERDIDLLVWDPYNRSQSHNATIQTEVMENKVDAATSMSVLNVIPDPESRLAHINTLKSALIVGGKAYFKIWPGSWPLRASYLPSATESCYQANAYADRFLREIEVVFGLGNVELDKLTPNLIVAVKLTEAHTDQCDILRIQRKSERELLSLMSIRESSVRRLYSNNGIFKLFSTGTSFFEKMGDHFVEKNRHTVPGLQHEYDKRFGLVAYEERRFELKN